jgi:hypothetical protein
MLGRNAGTGIGDTNYRETFEIAFGRLACGRCELRGSFDAEMAA